MRRESETILGKISRIMIYFINMTGKQKGILSILLSAFGFALMAAFVRMADCHGESLSAFQKGFFRNIIAFAIALAIFLRTKKRRAILSTKISKALILRSLLGTIGIFSNFYALSHIPIAQGQALNKTAPFFTILCAWGFLGEKPSGKDFLKIAIGFAGALMVVKPDSIAISPASFLGLLGGAAAGAAYACLRKLGKENCDPSFVILFFSAFSTVVSLPFMAFDFRPMSVAQIFILSGAGLSAAAGQFGITLAYRFAKPKEIAVYDYSNLIFTLVLGLAFFGQMPQTIPLIGIIVIIIAAALPQDAAERRMRTSQGASTTGETNRETP